jgi:hypothetical protein
MIPPDYFICFIAKASWQTTEVAPVTTGYCILGLGHASAGIASTLICAGKHSSV